eukprot:2576415-Rhodomonas_salina.1
MPLHDGFGDPRPIGERLRVVVTAGPGWLRGQNTLRFECQWIQGGDPIPEPEFGGALEGGAGEGGSRRCTHCLLYTSDAADDM